MGVSLLTDSTTYMLSIHYSIAKYTPSTANTINSIVHTCRCSMHARYHCMHKHAGGIKKIILLRYYLYYRLGRSRCTVVLNRIISNSSISHVSALHACRERQYNLIWRSARAKLQITSHLPRIAVSPTCTATDLDGPNHTCSM